MVVSGGMNKKKHFLLDSSNWYASVSLLAAESSLVYIDFVRKAVSQKTPLDERPVDPSQQAFDPPRSSQNFRPSMVMGH